MTALRLTLQWFTDPVNWSGSDGVPVRLLEHLSYAGLGLLGALALALPLGLWVGHRRRGVTAGINIANIGRAIPTIGLVFGLVTSFGIRLWTVIVALIAIGLPPIFTNTVVGIGEVDPEVRDAARGMGLSDRALLLRVELPIAVAVVLAGVRTSAVQIVATTTFAAFAGFGGLGVYIRDGFGQRKTGEIIAGALLVAALSLLTEFVLARVQKAATPRGLRLRAAAAEGEGDEQPAALPAPSAA